VARRARSANGDLLEHPFQEQVEGIARFYGWLIYHTHRSDRSQPGFPDLVLVRGPELIFAELKTRTGRVDANQQRWLDALGAVSVAVAGATSDRRAAVARLRVDKRAEYVDTIPVVEVYVWRPDDWETIQARLGRGRRLVPPAFDPR
jgi:hypothetical protein